MAKQKEEKWYRASYWTKAPYDPGDIMELASQDFQAPNDEAAVEHAKKLVGDRLSKVEEVRRVAHFPRKQ